MGNSWVLKEGESLFFRIVAPNRLSRSQQMAALSGISVQDSRRETWHEGLWGKLRGRGSKDGFDQNVLYTCIKFSNRNDFKNLPCSCVWGPSTPIRTRVEWKGERARVCCSYWTEASFLSCPKTLPYALVVRPWASHWGLYITSSPASQDFKVWTQLHHGLSWSYIMLTAEDHVVDLPP